jgi:hypothetical protein
MTLNITVLSHDSAFQSSDARLSVWDAAARAYRIHDVKAHKQVPVFGRSWSASVSFTGVGRTRSIDVSEWLADAVSPLVAGPTAAFEDLIDALLSADDWLQWVPRADRRHTFTVAAFVGDRAVAVLVSNFEHVSGQTEPVARDRLFVTRRTVRCPVVIVTGQRGAVSRQDRRLLVHTIPPVVPPPVHNPPPEGALVEGLPQISVQVGANPEGTGMLERLGRVNERAAHAVPTVSRECVATLLQRDGQAWFFPMGYAEDEDFVPPFARHLMDRVPEHRKQRKHDERGRPLPIRLTQVMANRSSNPDAVLVGTVWTGLE